MDTFHHDTSIDYHGSLKSYIVGYGLSILCTLAAFSLMAIHMASGHRFPQHTELWISFALLALVQLYVQAVFFLHLGSESRSRWNVTVFLFALLVVIIIVGGSLWIMNNLQSLNMDTMFIQNHITPQDEND